MGKCKALVLAAFFILIGTPAQAGFILSSAILEFGELDTKQKDIEIISQSDQEDYIVAEVSEIVNAGLPDEKREIVTDPETSGLLVTPNKTILGPGSRKVLRFVLLKDLGEKEKIYRVVIKPVIKGVNNDAKIGLKVLVGYEALVIVRPVKIHVDYNAVREGKNLVVVNKGNSNVLFQNGTQCDASEKCKAPPVLRIYPGETARIELPLAKQVKYTVWDGAKSVDKEY